MSPKKELSRQAIVDVAYKLASEEGVSSLTMAKVARAAGLTRQALYWHFGTRIALLLDVVRHIDSRLSDSDALFGGMQGASALENLEFLMRGWLGQMPEVAPMLLALHGEALTDPEVREVLVTRFAGFRVVMRDIYLRPLEAEGLLKPGLDLDKAADFLIMIGSPPAWQQMTAIFGWSHEDYTDEIMRQVRSQLLAPDAAAR